MKNMKLEVEIYSEKSPEELAKLLSKDSPLNYKGKSKTGKIYVSKSDDKARLHVSGILNGNNQRAASLIEERLGFTPKSVAYYKSEMIEHTEKQSLALGELVSYLHRNEDPLFILRFIPVQKMGNMSLGFASMIGVNSRQNQSILVEDVEMYRD